MARRITAFKEGYVNINEVRDFLYGLKNTERSKVFLKVEQVDGYNCLCVYLDNDYPGDVNGHNGFKKYYQLQINKVED